MNKRIRKKKYKQSLVKCTKCECYTEYFREEDEGDLCPSCFADLENIRMKILKEKIQNVINEFKTNTE